MQKGQQLLWRSPHNAPAVAHARPQLSIQHTELGLNHILHIPYSLHASDSPSAYHCQLSTAASPAVMRVLNLGLAGGYALTKQSGLLDTNTAGRHPQRPPPPRKAP